MKKIISSAQISNILFCVIFSSFSSIIYADPPTRVIRLSDIDGQTSFLPAGEEQWVNGFRNRPLTIGDSLWNGSQTHSVLQISGALVCIGEESSVTLLNLTDSLAQLQLAQGTINLHVQRISPEQQYEIDTPNLAFVVQQPGYYRITVDENGETTAISVREGKAQVYGETAAYEIDKNQSIRFSGTDLSNYQPFESPLIDENDDWCFKHLPPAEKVISSRYVSEDVIGYEDLDHYGRWQEIEEYGMAWSPTEPIADWAPYRDGRWVWIEPWGWTWVGDEPWGFAPYHYGRWTYVSGTWYWIPGPKVSDAVYAPALVAFIVAGIGDDVAWFPLGPQEIYWPAYEVSANYFVTLNVSNTIINQALVMQAYQQPNWKTPYHNLSIPQAITAVPTADFVNSKLANQVLVHLPKEKIANATVASVAKLTPEQISVLGTTQQSKSKPTSKILDRQFLTKSKVPQASVPFKEKEKLLKQNAGKPLNHSALTRLQDKTNKPAQTFKVITPTHPIKLKNEISPKTGSSAQEGKSKAKSKQILKKIPPRDKQEMQHPNQGIKPEENLQQFPPKNGQEGLSQPTPEKHQRKVQPKELQRKFQPPEEDRLRSGPSKETQRQEIQQHAPSQTEESQPLSKERRREIQRRIQAPTQSEENKTQPTIIKREIEQQHQVAPQQEMQPVAPSHEIKKEIQQRRQAPQNEARPISPSQEIKREMQRQLQAPPQNDGRSVAPSQEIKKEVQQRLQAPPQNEVRPVAPSQEIKKEIQQRLQAPPPGQKATDNKQ
ncbi:MAG: hypothetical protein BGO43_03225 [Gammaproteobacteria bacterium 39-13]|nr:FecR domain-containing protein [Gammaproteobacteria bacterium]OJV87013.1 MAG: hypothetical protein BGO43_03225 [Gammaproteobacteria bacterium 39-13]